MKNPICISWYNNRSKILLLCFNEMLLKYSREITFKDSGGSPRSMRNALTVLIISSHKVWEVASSPIAQCKEGGSWGNFWSCSNSILNSSSSCISISHILLREEFFIMWIVPIVTCKFLRSFAFRTSKKCIVIETYLKKNWKYFLHYWCNKTEFDYNEERFWKNQELIVINMLHHFHN